MVFAGVPPPPMATQVQKMGGLTPASGAALWSSVGSANTTTKFAGSSICLRPGLGQKPEAEAETGPGSKPAAAYERHRIWLRIVAEAWRDYHESIHARLPFVHSSTDDAAATQIELRRSDERLGRAARNLVESLTPGSAPGVRVGWGWGWGGTAFAAAAHPRPRAPCLARPRGVVSPGPGRSATRALAQRCACGVWLLL
jgi:hypothetical protein